MITADKLNEPLNDLYQTILESLHAINPTQYPENSNEKKLWLAIRKIIYNYENSPSRNILPEYALGLFLYDIETEIFSFKKYPLDTAFDETLVTIKVHYFFWLIKHKYDNLEQDVPIQISNQWSFKALEYLITKHKPFQLWVTDHPQHYINTILYYYKLLGESNKRNAKENFKNTAYELLYSGGLSTKGKAAVNKFNRWTSWGSPLGFLGTAAGAVATSGASLAIIPGLAATAEVIGWAEQRTQGYKRKCNKVAHILTRIVFDNAVLNDSLEERMVGHKSSWLSQADHIMDFLSFSLPQYALLEWNSQPAIYQIAVQYQNGRIWYRTQLAEILDREYAIDNSVSLDTPIPQKIVTIEGSLIQQDFEGQIEADKLSQLFQSLPTNASVSALTPLRELIVKTLINRGHLNDKRTHIRDEDIKLLKEVVMKAVLKIEDPAIKLSLLTDMQNGDKFICLLMDIQRFSEGINPRKKRQENSWVGTRKDIESQIDRAKHQCIEQFFLENTSCDQTETFIQHQFRRCIDLLNIALNTYEAKGKISSYKQKIVDDLRTTIKNAEDDITMENTKQLLSHICKTIFEMRYYNYQKLLSREDDSRLASVLEKALSHIEESYPKTLGIMFENSVKEEKTVDQVDEENTIGKDAALNLEEIRKEIVKEFTGVIQNYQRQNQNKISTNKQNLINDILEKINAFAAKTDLVSTKITLFLEEIYQEIERISRYSHSQTTFSRPSKLAKELDSVYAGVIEKYPTLQIEKIPDGPGDFEMKTLSTRGNANGSG